MTDLMLIGIFILCIAAGSLVVKKSGGFVEQIFFKNPKMWYDVRERKESCRNTGFFGHSTAHKTERIKGSRRMQTGGAAGACSREDASGRRAMKRPLSAQSEKSRVSAEKERRRKDYRLKNYKAGMKHEWKTN